MRKSRTNIISAEQFVAGLLLVGLLLGLLPFMNGCVSATAGIATSNVPLEGKKYRVLGTAETSISWISFDMGILGFPLKKPPVDEALRDLMAQKGGNALINIRYSTDRQIFLIITRHRFHIKADVVKVEAEAEKPPEENKKKRGGGR